MQAEHINPFLTSVCNTFSTMLQCEARRGEISLAETSGQKFPISGVIGLSGKAAGTVVINLSKEVALKGASLASACGYSKATSLENCVK